jgi:STE24 endopeptidase
VRGLELGSIFTGLLYTGVLLAASGLLNLPFAVYETFVIEARYGFNKTRVTTFIADILKICMLGVLLGGPLLALVL